MYKILLPILILLSSCTSEEQAGEALTNSGFTNVNVERVFLGWGCSEGEYKYSFTATNSNGKVVQGHVCCAVMKGCTVRW